MNQKILKTFLHVLWETLIGIISAIDETKADKIDVQNKLDKIENDIISEERINEICVFEENDIIE